MPKNEPEVTYPHFMVIVRQNDDEERVYDFGRNEGAARTMYGMTCRQFDDPKETPEAVVAVRLVVARCLSAFGPGRPGMPPGQ